MQSIKIASAIKLSRETDTYRYLQDSLNTWRTRNFSAWTELGTALVWKKTPLFTDSFTGSGIMPLFHQLLFISSISPSPQITLKLHFLQSPGTSGIQTLTC